MCMPVKRLYYQLLAANVDQVDLSEIITNRDDRRLIIDSYSPEQRISLDDSWLVLLLLNQVVDDEVSTLDVSKAVTLECYAIDCTWDLLLLQGVFESLGLDVKDLEN